MHVHAATLLTSALLALPAGAGELAALAAGDADAVPSDPGVSDPGAIDPGVSNPGQVDTRPEPLDAASDWAGLDAEIQSLVFSAAPVDSGPRVGAMIRMSAKLSDYPESWSTAIDYGDLEARVFGEVGDFYYLTQVDFKFGDALLENAYARTRVLNDAASLTVGRYKTPILRSASLASNKLLFNDRAVIGRCFDFFDDGAMFQAGYGAAQFMLSVQSGLDGTEINNFYTGRFEYRFGGGVRNQSSARGGQKYWNWSTFRSTVGFMVLREESRIDGDGFGFDVALTGGYWYFHAEALHLGEDLTQFEVQDEGMRYFNLEGNSTPWSIALSYMLHPDLVSLQGRWQRLDDNLGTNIVTVGMSWNQFGWTTRFLIDASQVKDSTGSRYFVQAGTAMYLD